MQFPERFSNLPEYAFPRLRALLNGIPAGGPEIGMSIGEPRHPQPGFVGEIIARHIDEFGRYPPNDGTPELRQAISTWLSRRFEVSKDPETEIVALNGTREGLFNSAIALCPELKNGKRPKILIPNPFYQVYAVGSAAVGAQTVFLPCPRENGFLPDLNALSDATLDGTALFYLCSAVQPTRRDCRSCLVGGTFCHWRKSTIFAFLQMNVIRKSIAAIPPSGPRRSPRKPALIPSAF